MNLKEAFRFQNKLQSLMDEAQMILDTDRNICKTTTTVMHKKTVPERENETIVEEFPSEYAEQIDRIVKFLLYLLEEHERLAGRIRAAKAAQEIDMDAQVSLNARRQRIAGTLRYMADLRGSEVVIPNGGMGYCFNAEGNQVSYRCDARKVTTINYNRNLVRSKAAALHKRSDEISAKLDSCLVNSAVDYDAPFDVNDSFSAVFETCMGEA